MIKRTITEKIKKYARQYPIITITGPRQSGKTTLCKMIFKNKPYVSLENLDDREFARRDPRGFLSQFPRGAVLDEIQRVPGLPSYIQTIVDERQIDGMFILTGSQQFEVMSKISQSLAGRTAIVKLLPFSYAEIYRESKDISIHDVLYTGFYPRIFHKRLNPTEAMSFYTDTYIERDVRNILNIKDISKFETFLKLCAGRTGQILNLSSLGNDCGVNHNTIKSWITILEASFIITLLRTYYKNFNKRLIKSPKLYFLDTGLVSFLLDIHNPAHILSHPLKGALFETFIVSELIKQRFHNGLKNNLYYFRDHKGNEVDIILDFGIVSDILEIKSSQTVSSGLFKGLRYFSNLNNQVRHSYLLYGGGQNRIQEGIRVLNWKKVASINKRDL